MGSIFSPSVPQPPREDPSVTRERRAQERRAEEDRLRAIQLQLQGETERRQSGLFGVRSLLGPLGFGGRARTSLLGRG